MAKLLKMLWEYMDLTVLPFFETWSAHIFGGWQRVCWCTNEAFNQASPTKEFWENCPQKKGGHIYGKNEGWAYLRKLLYISVLDTQYTTIPWISLLFPAEPIIGSFSVFTSRPDQASNYHSVGISPAGHLITFCTLQGFGLLTDTLPTIV